MADQAERVILEAEDQVTPITDKANAALDGFEKKAESSHGKVIRISDQTRSSVQRLIASLEKQAETYGKSGVDRLITQRDQLLQRYNREPQAIDAITRSYEPAPLAAASDGSRNTRRESRCPRHHRRRSPVPAPGRPACREHLAGVIDDEHRNRPAAHVKRAISRNSGSRQDWKCICEHPQVSWRQQNCQKWRGRSERPSSFRDLLACCEAFARVWVGVIDKVSSHASMLSGIGSRNSTTRASRSLWLPVNVSLI